MFAFMCVRLYVLPYIYIDISFYTLTNIYKTHVRTNSHSNTHAHMYKFIFENTYTRTNSNTYTHTYKFEHIHT